MVRNNQLGRCSQIGIMDGMGVCARSATRAWDWLLFASVTSILLLTLYPYDFRNVSYVANYPDMPPAADPSWWSLLGLPLNVALFIPLGLALRGTLTKCRSEIGMTLLAVLLGAALSACVETLQAQLPSRVTSTPDLITNTVGALLGALLFPRYQQRIVAGLQALRGHLQSGLLGHNLVVWAVAYLLVAGVVAAWLQRQTALVGWDLSMPLVFANEATDDRPWTGELLLLEISNAPFDALARHGFVRRFATIDASTNNVLNLLYSDGAALSRAIAATGQLGLRLDFSTGEPEQFGPARLVSISKGGLARNLTVGQQGDALIVRLRSPTTGNNGRDPEFALPGVFRSAAPQSVRLSYDGRELLIHAETYDAAVFHLSPGSVLAGMLGATKVDELRGQRLVFLALALAPPSALLTLALRRRRWSAALQGVLAATLCGALGWGTEALLAAVSGSRISASGVMLGVLTAMLGVLLAWPLQRFDAIRH